MLATEPLVGEVRRVLIADDHPLYRDALREIVRQAYPEAEFFEAASAEQVLACVTSDSDFDLILLDLKLPGASGLSCLKQARGRASFTPVVVVSAVDDPVTMGEVVMAGATAYLPKSGSRQQFLDALRMIMSGGSYLPAEAMLALRRLQGTPQAALPGSPLSRLTSRQVRVLELLAEGLSNKQIARAVAISEITTKGHVSAILKKLGYSNRVQAAIAARKILSDV
jgi:DNA-binding NarL/FixJ family response regulator